MRRGALAVAIALSAVVVPSGSSASTEPADFAGVIYTLDAIPHANDVWALASDQRPHGGTLILRHDHGSWHTVPKPSLSDYFALGGPSEDAIWLTGDIGEKAWVGRWNGSRFVATTLPANVNGSAQFVDGSAADDVWAFGFTSTGTGSSYTEVVLHWNGQAWTAVPIPTNEDVVSLSALDPTDAWLVTSTDQLMHWDGTQWTLVHTFNWRKGRLFGVKALSAFRVLFVGGRYGHGWIEEYDGGQWHSDDMRGLVSGGWGLEQVTAADGDIWASGAVSVPNTNESRIVILHARGQQWHRQASPITGDAALHGLSAPSSGRAFAGGWYCRHPSYYKDCERTAFLAYQNGRWLWKSSLPS